MATKQRRDYWTRTAAQIAVDTGRKIAPWPTLDDYDSGSIVDDAIAEAQTRPATRGPVNA